MKKYFFLSLSLLIVSTLFSQKDEYNPYMDSLVKYEKKLKALGDSIVDGKNQFVRLDAVTDFIPMFVKALKFPGSYEYPFSDLVFMKKIQAPDNTFRIYNWTLKFDDRTFRYYGAIHMNNPDKLKLIPLYDKSDSIPYETLEDTVLTNENWYGLQYYEITMTRKKRVNYYILIGWDGAVSKGYQKFIEIMYFDKEGMPVFGAPIIKDKDSKKLKVRKMFQYNMTAFFTLKVVPEKNVIAFDNLVPPDERSQGKLWLYVPDGNYDYFQVKKGKLTFKTDLFKHVKMPEDGLNMKVQ
jgi:hypothetical protein